MQHEPTDEELCACDGHRRFLGGLACYCGEVVYEPIVNRVVHPPVVDLMAALEASVNAAKAARRNPETPSL